MKERYKIFKSKIIIFFVSLLCIKSRYLLDTNNKLVLDNNYKLIKLKK